MYLQSLIFSFVFAVHPHSPPLVPDNDLVHEDIDDIGPLSSIPAPDAAPLPRASGRQRAVVQVRPISVSQVVKDIAGRQPFQAVRDLDSTYMSGATFGSPCFPPFCGLPVRESLKRKAQDISRSESEVFSFLTNNTTSQEQAKQLLDIITNVSSSLIESHHFDYCNYCDYLLQLKFNPADIAHSSLPSMANAVKSAMLPECEVYQKSLHEGSLQ